MPVRGLNEVGRRFELTTVSSDPVKLGCKLAHAVPLKGQRDTRALLAGPAGAFSTLTILPAA
jgi:hypothetical protein